MTTLGMITEERRGKSLTGQCMKECKENSSLIKFMEKVNKETNNLDQITTLTYHFKLIINL